MWQHNKGERFLKKFYIAFVLAGLILAGTAFAYELPANLQKLNQDNIDYAVGFLGQISLVVAFMAGILSFLSPCVLPFLPAFFSYTFKEKKDITKMTFVFFSGFALAFTAIGLMASYLGKGILMFQQSINYVVILSGVLLVAFGIMSFFGKGFSSIIKPKRVMRHDTYGIFSFGVIFAIGWTACLGPVLAGILALSLTLNNYLYTAGLMIAYSLGIFLPLLVTARIFDKYNISKSKWFAGKSVEFKLFGEKIITHSNNMISGIIFILLGIAFVIYKGTGFVNSIDPFRTKIYFYEFQRTLLSYGIPNIDWIVAIGIIAIIYVNKKKIFRS